MDADYLMMMDDDEYERHRAWTNEMLLRMDEIASKTPSMFVGHNPEVNNGWRRLMFFRVHSDRKRYHPDVVKKIVSKHWGIEDFNNNIGAQGNGRWVVKHSNKQAVAQISEGPWHVGRDLLVTGEPIPMVAPSLAPLETEEFWVQILDIPVELLRSAAISVEKLVEQIGRLVRVDDDFTARVDSAATTKLRVRVAIDVAQPLVVKTKILLDKGTIMEFPVKYERLGRFCRYCGIMGHDYHGCKKYYLDRVPYTRREQAFPYSEACLKMPLRRRGYREYLWSTELMRAPATATVDVDISTSLFSPPTKSLNVGGILEVSTHAQQPQQQNLQHSNNLHQATNVEYNGSNGLNSVPLVLSSPKREEAIPTEMAGSDQTVHQDVAQQSEPSSPRPALDDEGRSSTTNNEEGNRGQKRRTPA